MRKCIASIALSLTQILLFYVNAEGYLQCGKISDYTYNDGDSNVIVANRDAGKQIAITFDDGPGKEYTPEILDILNEYGIKATFFVVGKNAENNPEILKRIYTEGHEIGNHTYSHPDFRKLTTEQVEDEIEKTQSIIEDITGAKPKLFRPPGGYLSNSIMDIITSKNYITVLWSWRQDTTDWKSPPVKDVVNIVLTNIKDGDIILFHDQIFGESPTPKALKIIIPELLEKGYEFVTVSELMK
ncbi:MAG: polysaccharide deacetylase family protein [Clostridia bacterium]|nr:polysaccharide deacetylase family protein [Clostridia bacterium]